MVVWTEGGRHRGKAWGKREGGREGGWVAGEGRSVQPAGMVLKRYGWVLACICRWRVPMSFISAIRLPLFSWWSHLSSVL